MINKKYLNKKKLENISNIFYSNSPINYFIFDDFIDDLFYKKIEKEFQNLEKLNIENERKAFFIKNKTLLLNWEYSTKLYNFFISEKFENFLSIIFKKDLQKYRKKIVDKNKQLDNKITNSEFWIFQIYEKWDFLWWHTDIAKDMKMRELITKWWFEEWDKCIITEYDEIGAFIYYIYNSDNNWKEEYGGVLELWKIENNKINSYKKVLPLRNRFVIIKSSNKSYHRVTKVESNEYRISIQDLLYKKWVKIWKEILY